MRFSTLYSSPQGCTCYDNKNSQCAPNYWCNECRNNPNNPNCNMRVGNQVVPRYQTQSGIGGIFATPTNRFRNAACSMFMGIDNGGFSMPMGISERVNFQNANGSAEEIGGKQENPTRGLYAVEINSAREISNDKLLYNLLVNAMRNQGLTIPRFFSPKLINKGYRRGNFSYLFEIRDGFRASNFVQDKMLGISPFMLKGKIPINYTATFISGYLHSPKMVGGGGRPLGGGEFNSAVGMGNPTMVAPAFGGTKTPSSGINNYCIKCYKKGCGCIRDERGRPRCDCGEMTPSGVRFKNFCKRHPELCSGLI